MKGIIILGQVYFRTMATHSPNTYLKKKKKKEDILKEFERINFFKIIIIIIIKTYRAPYIYTLRRCTTLLYKTVKLTWKNNSHLHA